MRQGPTRAGRIKRVAFCINKSLRQQPGVAERGVARPRESECPKSRDARVAGPDAGPGRRGISGSNVGILSAYGTVTRQCPANPHIRRAVCTQTKEAAHWSQVRAPIRRHRPCHADMHGKREAAQVIGTMMGSLGRVRIARFDARPCCAPPSRMRTASNYSAPGQS